MRNGISFLFSLLFFTSFGQVEYPVHLDSKVQEGVPQGEVLGPFMHESTVFPGTVREYWIYVPKQYKKENPAALMVSFDGFNMAVNQLTRSFHKSISIFSHKYLTVIIR